MKFSNGSRVLALPSSTDGANLRGWTVTGCVAIDEAAFIRNLDAIMQAIAPTLWGDGYADGELVYDMYDCPNCGKQYELYYEKYDYCPNCGQRIDRSELE